MNLSDTWAALESKPHGPDTALLMQSSHDGVHSAVAAGLRVPDAQRVLILRLDSAQARILQRQGMTTAITLTRLQDDRLFSGQVNIELASADQRYQELFTLIGDDLIAQLEDDPVNAGHVILARLDLWREFLRRREEGDTERWARGLFGELWYLKHHVLPHRPGLAGLGCWLGPAGAAHDFELGACTIELKTGTTGSETVSISSLQQLTPSPGSKLLLGHLRLRRDSQGMTLRELSASIRAMLPPEAHQLLESRLLAAGYVEQDRELRDDLRLAVQDLRIFHVTSGFPALTVASVPVGIEQCTYTINLASCHYFQVPTDFPWNPALEITSNNEH
ncbi:PD-(D/E)XK motif protein [Deinococcus sp. Marseille-Q6407]|uniref:PD-(D/E)XK motif protein n=1 Tax=Deinococcus sp. Marseille-Q6407 TaxID=2969223 RepID=UPI0021BFCB5E|nr:PD-(D/E)XK motif protein [Deinococcus sp. Marseille-Q6407]